MVIKSAYVNKDLNFDVIEKLDPLSNQTMVMIKHDSLRDVVYNQLGITKKGSVTYNYVKADSDHTVVECTIDDGMGRVVTEIGEAVPETLENDIARNYPALIASQRAFDRAAILLLMLAGKQFSNGEIGEFLAVDFEPTILKSEIVTNEIQIEEDKPYKEASIETTTTVEEEEIMDIPEGLGDVVEEPIEEPIDVTYRLNELGDMVFDAGKYSGKPNTIAQIYKENAEYLRKLLAIPKPAPELAPKLEWVREYIKLVEV